MDLIIRNPGPYHVSLDTVWEFEKAILEDVRVRRWSSKYNFLSALPNLFWRRIRGVQDPPPDGKPHPPTPRDMFTVLMGLNIRKTMPRYLLPGRKSVYLFDAWPSTHDKIQNYAESCQIDYLFLSSQQATKMLQERLPHVSCHWIPEGINPESYHYLSLAEKDIDVLQLGRRYNSYHNLIVEPLAQADRVYFYEKIAGQIIFPTRAEYLDALARSRISICVPATLTHPDRAGGIETMTTRYLQSMLSKCLILGHAPRETIELFGYNPIIEIDTQAPVAQLQFIMKNIAEYSSLIEKNYQTVLAGHTWQHRWRQIASLLWS